MTKLSKHLNSGDMLPSLQMSVWAQRESLHCMSLQIMGSERVTALLPYLTSLLTCPFFLLFLTFCSPPPSPSLSFFFPPCLSLSSSSHPPHRCPQMYVLCVWPEGTGWGLSCLKDRRIAPTDYYEPWLQYWEQAFYHIVLMSDLCLKQKQHINLNHKDVALWLCCHNSKQFFSKKTFSFCIKYQCITNLVIVIF